MRSAEIIANPQRWINNSQLLFIIVITRNITWITLTPVITSGYTRQDAWIATIIAMVVSLLWMTVIIAIHKRMPTYTLGQIINKVFGRYIGKVILLVFFAYFVLIATHQLSLIRIIKSMLLLETPDAVARWSVLLVIWYSLYKGPASLIRTTGLLFFIMIVNKLLIAFFLIPQLDLQQLKPILYNGWKPVLVGSIVPTVLFFETIFVLHLLPLVKDNKLARKMPFIGIIFSGIMLIILVIMLVAIFGPVEAERLQFPFYSLAREVTVGDFLERVEALIVIVWLTNLFVSITLMLYMAREILVQISTRLQQYNQYVNVGLIVMLELLGPRLFSNTVDISDFYSPMQYGLIGFLVPGLIPIIMYFVMLIRKQGVK